MPATTSPTPRQVSKQRCRELKLRLVRLEAEEAERCAEDARARVHSGCSARERRSAASLHGGGAEAIVDAVVEGGGRHRLGTGQVSASPHAKGRLGLHESQRAPAPLSRFEAKLAAQRRRDRVA